ncbi:MAG: DUF3313 domain-containing protein [Planctomycetota bacterium]|jgi:hypothetical protein
MRIKSLFASATALTLVVTLGGCKMTAHETGFLSDYSKLKEEDDALRYVNTDELKTYNSFIVDPVQMVSHKGAEPTDPKAAEVVTSALQKNLVTKLREANYNVVKEPGPGVARLRVAITDVDNSVPVLNWIPQTKLLGLGIGGASMEAEVVDSRTDKQIGAVVQGKKGSRLSFAGMTSRQGDAKAVCGNWAEAFVQRVNKVHGR